MGSRLDSKCRFPIRLACAAVALLVLVSLLILGVRLWGQSLATGEQPRSALHTGKEHASQALPEAPERNGSDERSTRSENRKKWESLVADIYSEKPERLSVGLRPGTNEREAMALAASYGLKWDDYSGAFRFGTISVPAGTGHTWMQRLATNSIVSRVTSEDVRRRQQAEAQQARVRRGKKPIPGVVRVIFKCTVSREQAETVIRAHGLSWRGEPCFPKQFGCWAQVTSNTPPDHKERLLASPIVNWVRGVQRIHVHFNTKATPDAAMALFDSIDNLEIESVILPPNYSDVKVPLSEEHKWATVLQEESLVRHAAPKYNIPVYLD